MAARQRISSGIAKEFSLHVAGTKVEAHRLPIDLAALRVWRRSDGISNFEFSGQDDLLGASFLSVRTIFAVDPVVVFRQ